MVHFEDFRNLPTIMGIDQEIDVMSALMGMPTDYINDHAAEFQTLIDDLANSHQISGYFDIRPENEENLLCFADWLEPMLTRFEIPDVTAKFFRFTYQDLLEAYPNLRALDAEDKPTRPNRDSTGSAGTESAKDLQAFRDMPREMRASAELAVMRALKAMSVDYLVAHRNEFVEIVERLDGSHGSSQGGLYELTPHNEAEFHDFSSWLRELSPLMGWSTTKRWSFDVTFTQTAKKYPQLRKATASGPQPGSPLVAQLAERVKEIGTLEILGAGAAWKGITLVGEGWALAAGRAWRVLNPDGTLAFTWSTPNVEEYVTDLVGLRVEEVTAQSRMTMTDPALRLSDGRWLEIFSNNPLTPWTMRIAAGTFTGAPPR